jgi:hypothetical protein
MAKGQRLKPEQIVTLLSQIGANSIKAIKINARQRLKIDKLLMSLYCKYKKIAVNITVKKRPNLIFEGI